MKLDDKPIITISGIEYVVIIEFTDPLDINSFAKNLKGQYPGNQKTYSRTGPVTMLAKPFTFEGTLLKFTLLWPKEQTLENPDASPLIIYNDDTPTAKYFCMNWGAELFINFVNYLENKAQDPQKFRTFNDYSWVRTDYRFYYDAIHYEIRPSPEIQEQAIKEKVEIAELIERINPLLAELETRMDALPEGSRKVLLDKLVFPKKLYDIQGALEFDDKSIIGSVKPTVTYLYPGENQRITLHSEVKDWVKEETLDVFAEIKSNIKNIRKPPIWACIMRWVQIIRYKHIISKKDYEIAMQHLEKLGRTIIENAELRIIPKEVAIRLNIDNVELHYLKELFWKNLRDTKVRHEHRTEEKLKLVYKNLGITLDKTTVHFDDYGMNLLISLIPKFTETDISPIDQLLDIDRGVSDNQPPRQYTPTSGLPYVCDRINRCLRFMQFISSNESHALGFRTGNFDKMYWDSFNNAFITWKLSKDSDQPICINKDSVKTYLSDVKKILKKKDAKELDELKQDSLARYGAIHDVSNDLLKVLWPVKINQLLESVEILNGLPTLPYTPPTNQK